MPEVENWEIEAGNIPSRGVSGDFFKVELRHDESEIVLMLSDVSGKGIGASLLTASLEALCAGPVHDGVPPEEIFRSVGDLTAPRRNLDTGVDLPGLLENVAYACQIPVDC